MEDIPIKVDDFYVLINFMILGMVEDARTQIIPGRPFLTTAGCKIDVKEGRLSIDVGEKHAEFGLFKDFKSAPSTYSCYGCDVIDLDEPEHLLYMPRNDPSNLNCALLEGQ